MSQTALTRANRLFTLFKQRELSRIPIKYETTEAGTSIPKFDNPFLSAPKAPGSKTTRGPKYSLRRQKELLKAAKLLSQTGVDPTALQFLPPGPKTVERVTGGGVDKALTALRGNATVSVAGITSAMAYGKASSASGGDDPTTDVGAIWRGKPNPRKTIGMYEGRKVAFKRHIWERERKERQTTIKKAVQGMEQRVDEWRKVCLCAYYQFNQLTLHQRREGKTAGTKLPF
jgi:hypothetical protein